MKTAATRTAWVGLMTGLVILCMSAINQKKGAVLTGVDVRIDGFEHGDVFLTKEDVQEEIVAVLGTVENQLVSAVNVTLLEEVLYQNPFIQDAEVFISSDGVLSVTIHQRQPLFRTIAGNGKTYYIDRHGMQMPVSPNFTARVVVVTGDVGPVDQEGVAGHKQLAGVYRLAMRAEQDPFLKSLIEQIHVKHDGTITLIPKVGDMEISFGRPDKIALKLESLKSFYTQVVKKRGWDQYENINLTYDGQIVCKRKES